MVKNKVMQVFQGEFEDEKKTGPKFLSGIWTPDFQ